MNLYIFWKQRINKECTSSEVGHQKQKSQHRFNLSCEVLMTPQNKLTAVVLPLVGRKNAVALLLQDVAAYPPAPTILGKLQYSVQRMLTQ
jgi:hypothetical protein